MGGLPTDREASWAGESVDVSPAFAMAAISRRPCCRWDALVRRALRSVSVSFFVTAATGGYW